MTAHARGLAIGAAIIAAAACTGLSADSRQRAEGSFDKILTVSGRVDLDVQSGSGRIEAKAGQVDKVEVHARITASDWNPLRGGPSAAERVRRIEANPPVEQTGNRIRIGRIDDPDLRNVSISYTLVVPPRTALVGATGSGSMEISGLGETMALETGSGSIVVRDAGGEVRATTGSGSIEASGVAGAITARTGSGGIVVTQTGRGNVDVSTGSGSVRVNGVRGAVKASTSSGTLRVRGEQTGEWRLSSSSGGIEITFAGKPAFDLDAQTGSGHIDTAFPVTVSGTISRRELRGPVNGGGPLLHLRTSSGSISIR